MAIDAVIFDMDGLMIDTEPVANRAWKRTFAELGYTLTDELNLRMIGRNVPDSDRIVLEAMGRDFPIDRCRARANGLYMELLAAEGIPLKKGLLELLDFLKMRTVPLAVATSTPRSFALHKLAATGLDSSFAAIVAGDDVSRGKPAPDLFLEAARRLRAAPARCVALEDSPAGVRAAHAAGMAAIMVPDLVKPDSETQALSFAVAPSLLDARLLIAGLLEEKNGRGRCDPAARLKKIS